jgi:WD40 repeat protein/serine/threonine protein kinase
MKFFNKSAKPDYKKTGTVLRQPDKATPITREKGRAELTALEMADKQDWEVKTLPVWKPGDVILDTYEVENVISGGMGHVYIANHKNWNVKLAIKSPNEMMLSDRSNFARILREANSWIELGLHPNIAYCYYVRNIEDVPHIFVEYVDGGNLRQWIEDGKCIDYRLNLDLAIQFCHGMEYAHSRGMIHRDIKPENILMTKEGVLLITDFGLVRSGNNIQAKSQIDETSKRQRQSVLTFIGDEMGTWGYMSPEQKENPHEVDERTDIFALGICLYEMFCGNRPYEITFGPEQEPPDPKKIGADDALPAEISQLLKNCIKWRPSDRYKNFREIRAEIIRIYEKLFNEDSLYAGLELYGIEPDRLNNKGVSLLELGETEKSVSCFKKALEINETHPEATYNLSLIQWRGGKIDDLEFVNRLENCIQDPDNNKKHLSKMLAAVHAERFDFDAAREVLEKWRGTYDEMFSGTKYSQFTCKHTIRHLQYPVHTISIAGDAKHVLSVDRKKTVLWKIRGPFKWSWTVQVHKGGGKWQGAYFDIDSIVWTVRGKKKIFRYKPFYFIKFWHTKRSLPYDVEKSDMNIKFFRGLQALRTFKAHSDKINCIAKAGNYVVSASEDKTIKVWKFKAKENYKCQFMLCRSKSFESFRKQKIKRIEVQELIQEGNYKQAFTQLTGLWKSIGYSEDKNLYSLYQKAFKAGRIKGFLMPPISEKLADKIDDTFIFAISRRANYLIAGKGGRSVRLWELSNGECLQRLKVHSSSVNSVALSPDDVFAVSGSDDKTLKLWEVQGNQNVLNLKGHTKPVNSVVISKGGRLILSGSSDNTLKLWDTKKRQCIRTFKGHSGPVNSVALSREGEFAVSGSDDKTVNFWTTNNNKAQNSLRGHSEKVVSVSLSADGKFALSGSLDKTLKLWELETGQCLQTFHGHVGIITSVTFINGSNYAISGSTDHTLKLWDIKSAQCISTLEGHSDAITSIAVSKDGSLVVSASKDKTIRLWRFIWDLEFD